MVKEYIQKHCRDCHYCRIVFEVDTTDEDTILATEISFYVDSKEKDGDYRIYCKKGHWNKEYRLMWSVMRSQVLERIAQRCKDYEIDN